MAAAEREPAAEGALEFQVLILLTLGGIGAFYTRVLTGASKTLGLENVASDGGAAGKALMEEYLKSRRTDVTGEPTTTR